MSSEQIRSFDEFWPYYVRAHANKANRALHFAGTTAAVACALGALVFRRPKLALAAPIIGYSAAWIGHFLVEKNVPAAFGHPLWSLKADFVMWSKIFDGTMDAEVERVLAEAEAEARARAEAEAAAAAPPAAPTPDVNVYNAHVASHGAADRYTVN